MNKEGCFKGKMKKEESLEERLKADEKDAEIERLHANLAEAEKKLKDYSKKDKHYETLENELEKAKKKLAKYEKAKGKEPKKEGKKQRQQKKAQLEEKVIDPKSKEYGAVGKTFQYVSSVTAGVAAGIGGFLAADYLTGSHAAGSYNTAGYITLALVGAANGVCGEAFGVIIAGAKYKISSTFKKINKILILHFPIGAAAGGAFSAIGRAIDDKGLIGYLGGLFAPIAVGYLVRRLTGTRKKVK